jgi:hypothetical protein
MCPLSCARYLSLVVMSPLSYARPSELPEAFFGSLAVLFRSWSEFSHSVSAWDRRRNPAVAKALTSSLRELNKPKCGGNTCSSPECNIFRRRAQAFSFCKVRIARLMFYINHVTSRSYVVIIRIWTKSRRGRTFGNACYQM